MKIPPTEVESLFAPLYMALVEVIWELHEQAHVQVGRLLWAVRARQAHE